MTTFDISPLFRTTGVGFDRAWDHLNTAMSLEGGFPAYNILRSSEDEFQISLAVPGYTENDITVETRDRSVWVKGERSIDTDHNRYLYRGIRDQGFQRSFQLPEHVKVTGARLEAGLLHIDLVRELPEALRPRKIEVVNGDQSRPVLQDSSKAA